MVVRFMNEEYPDDMTVEELAIKLGIRSGFVVVGNAFKRNIGFDTYKPENSSEITAQEVIDSC